MTCLNTDRAQLSRLGAASVTPVSRPSASADTASAANVPQQPTLTYGVLAAARSQVCSELAEKPHSRRLQGAANFATHLMLMLELEARQ